MGPRLVVLVALGSLGCGRGTRPQGPAPASPQQALAEFMTAVKAKDLTRMGELWGSERGPAASYMKPEVLHERLTLIQIYLNHVDYRVLEGPDPVPGQERLQRFRLELQRANSCTVAFPMDLVHAKSGAWLVTSVDLARLPNPRLACTP